MGDKLKVDIMLPVYNEEEDLKKSVIKLRKFLIKAGFSDKYQYKIKILDNASKDNTLQIAKNLSKKYQEVSYISINRKGRGRALKKAWRESSADIISYMDIDLSTGLNAFPIMISALENGFDIAFGSRLLPNSRIKRSLKREILSRGYNFLLRLILRIHFSDAQCGFKGITRKAAKALLPKIKDNEWFFDTELLVLAEKSGYRLFEIPVGWIEDPKSTVKISQTILNYLKSIFRMRFNLGLFEKVSIKEEATTMTNKILKLRSRIGKYK